MKENKKIVLLSVVLIILVVIFVVHFIVNFININPAEKARKEYGYETMGVYVDSSIKEELQKEKNLQYKNIEIVQELKGELPVSTVISKVRKTFLEEIPKVILETKNMTKNELI